MDLTPAQSRAARGLLDMSQKELADAANVGLSTVRGFENGTRKPIPNNVAAIKKVLADRGIMFFGTTGVVSTHDDLPPEPRHAA